MIINYLIQFLIGCEADSDIINMVGYTDDERFFDQYKVVIIPSGFFEDTAYGKACSMPALPLEEIEGIPFLYGQPKTEKKNSTLILHADLLASAYFLLSRYEEYVRTDGRDIHGRFMGKESIAYKAGFLHRPVVDEYGRLLRHYLRESGVDIPEPSSEIRKIYLTHDVDAPYMYRTWRNLSNTLLRNTKKFPKALKHFLGNLEKDPLFTFPWIIKENARIDAETVFFIRSVIKPCLYDKPYYKLDSKEIKHMLGLMKEAGSTIGLHCSYLSGDEPDLISLEKQQLEQHIGKQVTCNRNHFLRSKQPADTQYLAWSGITDDFTMGYADVAGFRLGTCRPVKWINVATREVSQQLTLHPLVIMDVSLSEPKYMNLNMKDAYNYAVSLIDKVREFNGELVLLWHNNTLSNIDTFGHKTLYSDIIDYLK